jgi:hypothetical protein
MMRIGRQSPQCDGSYRTVLHAAISAITKGRQPMVVAETLVQ